MPLSRRGVACHKARDIHSTVDEQCEVKVITPVRSCKVSENDGGGCRAYGRGNELRRHAGDYDYAFRHLQYSRHAHVHGARLNAYGHVRDQPFHAYVNANAIP